MGDYERWESLVICHTGMTYIPTLFESRSKGHKKKYNYMLIIYIYTQHYINHNGSM